ncbi:MAG: hypothetical protein R2715_03920 [Ilumatobacteraceae bacterium]
MKLQRALTMTWYLGSLAYSTLRITLARRFLGPYGLSTPELRMVEFTSLLPYSIGVARGVTSWIERRRDLAMRWAAVASIGFAAPDVYLVSTTRQVPVWLYVVLGTWVLTTALLGYRTDPPTARRGMKSPGRPNQMLRCDVSSAWSSPSL